VIGVILATAALSGGAPVDFQTVPYVASLGGCTATLIAPDRVLTAAHSLLEKPDPSTFAESVGVEAHADIPPAAARRVKGYAIAPGFKLAFPFAHRSPQNATAVNDVALIVLAKPVKGVTPIRIAGPGDRALEQPGDPVRLLGYGITKPRSFDTPPLQGGDLSVISAGDCRKAYPGAIVASEICAQDLAPGELTQPCPGDSGGPLISQGVQIGVTSWASEVKDKDCGEARLPGVWMRVSSFYRFLTAPDPVLMPHTRGKVRIRGKHRLTCVAPRFGGSPAQLRYHWGAPHPRRLIKGATSRHFTRHGGAKVFCKVTARNAGGSFTVYSRAR
jgi:hypothetical protein